MPPRNSARTTSVARASGSRSSSGADTPFARRVLRIVARVPVGRVTTYGAVAKLAGRPGAARAVGNIMRKALMPNLPYHRVIAAGGLLGGYSIPAMKRQLLSAEGHVVTSKRVKRFEQVKWP
ncbi:MAG: MGMT family protein [Acidobacteria bacterium]|nr:MGMT family protein [Acidobacteriota bacterium]